MQGYSVPLTSFRAADALTLVFDEIGELVSHDAHVVHVQLALQEFRPDVETRLVGFDCGGFLEGDWVVQVLVFGGVRGGWDWFSAARWLADSVVCGHFTRVILPGGFEHFYFVVEVFDYLGVERWVEEE